MPSAQGVGHIMLTVTDVQRSADFYNRLLDGKTIMSATDEHGALAVCIGPALMVGFRTRQATEFDPVRVGLDHIGIHVQSRAELEQWRRRMDEQGVLYSPIVEDQFGVHLNAKDPDNIAIEFFTTSD
ncbi:VOC family protein [Phytohabitans rumicis]|uniref:Glyoxalase n=1 Tax=Phytohabitans rumicis TaxID=1076125 RepID=A0A6V8LJM9_9ACTN|nr:VOC family protein [Phytohabitans rumicis]GFJ95078.1 glyoxalase [Phytohabitans rumicis]